MPCSDSLAFDRMYHEQEVQKLKDRNDQLIRVICKIDQQLMNDDGWKLFLLSTDKEVRKVVEEHRITDEERWWSMYHSTYPDFNIGEIAKMVRAGILED